MSRRLRAFGQADHELDAQLLPMQPPERGHGGKARIGTQSPSSPPWTRSIPSSEWLEAWGGGGKGEGAYLQAVGMRLAHDLNVMLTLALERHHTLVNHHGGRRLPDGVEMRLEYRLHV